MNKISDTQGSRPLQQEDLPATPPGYPGARKANDQDVDSDADAFRELLEDGAGRGPADNEAVSPGKGNEADRREPRDGRPDSGSGSVTRRDKRPVPGEAPEEGGGGDHVRRENGSTERALDASDPHPIGKGVRPKGEGASGDDFFPLRPADKGKDGAAVIGQRPSAAPVVKAHAEGAAHSAPEPGKPASHPGVVPGTRTRTGESIPGPPASQGARTYPAGGSSPGRTTPASGSPPAEAAGVDDAKAEGHRRSDSHGIGISPPEGRDRPRALSDDDPAGRHLQRDTGTHVMPQGGDAILRAFQGPPPPPVSPEQAASPLYPVAREIADTILVSDTSAGGREEVRITLKDSVLPRTEVRIYKDGGEIHVEMVTTSANSHDLMSGRKGELIQVLKERVGENVSVDVKFSQSGQDHGDGRSRQQRSVYDELEEDRS